MSTVHNRIYTQVLANLLSTNFDALAAVGSIVDNGEHAPPGSFEPWMRTEVSCWVEAGENCDRAYIMFRAGPFNEPFQEVLATVVKGDTVEVIIEHTIPNDEYPLCEIAQFMMHLVIAQTASLEGKPGCCCGNNHDGSEHIHDEFVVAAPEALEGEVIQFGNQMVSALPTEDGQSEVAPTSASVREFKPRILH